MYINKEYKPEISIALDNGIYVFDSESATGKTWLCKHLKKLKAYGEPVDVVVKLFCNTCGYTGYWYRK